MKPAFVLATLFLLPGTVLAISIDMVTVGNPGNAPDSRYLATSLGLVGSVGYAYQIGKYEVTAGQYTEFLNAVAREDTYGLYWVFMGDIFSHSNIQRSGDSPNYNYSVAADWANRPVNHVTFWNAARFANWLHNGQPIGPQGPGTTEEGAYHDIGNQLLFGRHAGARFFIPTLDEWHKAAFHDKPAGTTANYFEYPTGSNAAPGIDRSENTNPGNNANYSVGGPNTTTRVGDFELSDSPYGTFDQGGNVSEWNETLGLLPNTRWVRGGNYGSGLLSLRASSMGGGAPDIEIWDRGFRIASVVPEPSTLLLAITAFATLLTVRRKSVPHNRV